MYSTSTKVKGLDTTKTYAFQETAEYRASMPKGLVREQTYWESLLEAKTNIAIGFVISWLVWVLVVSPLYGFDFAMFDSIGITCIFTVTSLARQYAVRRWFNKRAKV